MELCIIEYSREHKLPNFSYECNHQYQNEVEKIFIGNNDWVEWRTINPKNERVKDIDEILKPTKNLWKNLEYYCVPECCGIMAFSFEEKDIWSASLDLNITELITRFETILEKISNIEEQIVSSTILNQLMDKTLFENLIRKLIKVLLKLSKNKNNYT